MPRGRGRGCAPRCVRRWQLGSGRLRRRDRVNLRGRSVDESVGRDQQRQLGRNPRPQWNDIDHRRVHVRGRGSTSGSSTGGAGAGYPEPGDWPAQTGPRGPSITTSGDRRETHAAGFSLVRGRWYAATAHVEAGLLNTGGGVMFWDVTNPAQPLPLSTLESLSVGPKATPSRVVPVASNRGPRPFAQRRRPLTKLGSTAPRAEPRRCSGCDDFAGCSRSSSSWHPSGGSRRTGSAGNPSSCGRTTLPRSVAWPRE